MKITPKVVYTGMILAIVATGLAMILKLGYNPTPELIMKPSKFAKPEEIGVVLYRRFYGPIEQRKAVVFGVRPSPDWHRDIVRGFLQAAAATDKPFEVLISEAQMPALDLSGLPPIEVHTVPMNSPSQAEWHDEWSKAKQSGKRTLIYTASLFSSGTLKGNPLDRFEKSSGEDFISISTATLALSASDEHQVDPPCLGSERDVTGTSPLGCAILSASRGFYRKKIKADSFVAIMNAPLPNDYLLMVASPSQPTAQH